MTVAVVTAENNPGSAFAVGLLIAWLIPRIYIDLNRTLRLVAVHSRKYIKGEASSSGMDNNKSNNVNTALLEKRRKRVIFHAFVSVSIWSAILIGCAAVVFVYTRELDPRMEFVLAGLARMAAAVILLFLSLEIPQWLGVYNYLEVIRVHDDFEQDQTQESFKIKENNNNNNNNTNTTNIKAEEEEQDKDDKDDQDDQSITISTPYRQSSNLNNHITSGSHRRTKRASITTYLQASAPEAVLVDPTKHTHEGDGKNGNGENDDDNDDISIPEEVFSMKVTLFDLHWTIFGQFIRIFWIVLLFCCGTHHNWSLPVAVILGSCLGCFLVYLVYIIRKVGKNKPQRKRQLAYFLMTIMALTACVIFAMGAQYIQEVWRTGNASDYWWIILTTFFVSLVVIVTVHYFAYRLSNESEPDDASLSVHSRPALSANRYDSELFQPPKAFDTVTHGAMKMVRKATSSFGHSPRKDSINDNDVDDDDSSYHHVEKTSADDRKQPSADEEQPTEEVQSDASTLKDASYYDIEEPSLPLLCLSRFRCCMCCCAPCGWTERGTFSRLNCTGRFVVSVKWILRVIGHGFCFYTTIVNIMATEQGIYAKKLFPSVNGILYEGQENGPVCAYLEPFKDEVTQTFENEAAAEAAGYTLAHCGACAACSKWQNLRLQWTTRRNLAALSQKCSTVLMFKGFKESAECYMDDDVGFDRECAECWVNVSDCAMKHCTFIFLQSWMINNLGNFEVGPDVVTAAMCEEAICEVEFVPCSGANRRRMNIVSDIARPGKQQCPLIPESNSKWLDLFGPADKEL